MSFTSTCFDLSRLNDRQDRGHCVGFIPKAFWEMVDQIIGQQHHDLHVSAKQVAGRKLA